MINFRNKLNAQLIYLGGQIDTNEPKPTAASLLRLQELATEWNSAKEGMTKLIDGPIAKFNAAYKQSDLPALIALDE